MEKEQMGRVSQEKADESPKCFKMRSFVTKEKKISERQSGEEKPNKPPQIYRSVFLSSTCLVYKTNIHARFSLGILRV